MFYFLGWIVAGTPPGSSATASPRYPPPMPSSGLELASGWPQLLTHSGFCAFFLSSVVLGPFLWSLPCRGCPLVREDSSHVSIIGGRCVHGRHLHIETLALLRIVARSSVALRQPSRSKVTMVSPAFSPSFLLPLPNDGLEVVFPSVGDMRHIPQHGARTYTEGVADRI